MTKIAIVEQMVSEFFADGFRKNRVKNRLENLGTKNLFDSVCPIRQVVIGVN